jgi:hypothetical protein
MMKARTDRWLEVSRERRLDYMCLSPRDGETMYDMGGRDPHRPRAEGKMEMKGRNLYCTSSR